MHRRVCRVLQWGERGVGGVVRDQHAVEVIHGKMEG